VSEDPQWPRASTWLAQGRTGTGRRLGVVGVPLSRTSISATGAHETPAAVRAALRLVLRLSNNHDYNPARVERKDFVCES